MNEFPIADPGAQPRTLIKFCGMTRAEDIAEAAALGVDAVGLILVGGSPRALTLDVAIALRASIPTALATVVLLRNPNPPAVLAAVTTLRPDLLQFHGEEHPEFCRDAGLPYLKGVAMRDAKADTLRRAARRYPDAAGLVLDGHAAGELGGQGSAFDWTQARNAKGPPLVLAGGLTPDNVAEAIRIARPAAVDVSSGIEAAAGAKGIKDWGRMRAFVEAVRRADASLAESHA